MRLWWVLNFIDTLIEIAQPCKDFVNNEMGVEMEGLTCEIRFATEIAIGYPNGAKTRIHGRDTVGDFSYDLLHENIRAFPFCDGFGG